MNISGNISLPNVEANHSLIFSKNIQRSIKKEGITSRYNKFGEYMYTIELVGTVFGIVIGIVTIIGILLRYEQRATRLEGRVENIEKEN